jgi:hypothetical protein
LSTDEEEDDACGLSGSSDSGVKEPGVIRTPFGPSAVISLFEADEFERLSSGSIREAEAASGLFR